jgi:hypothetical protein
LLSAAALAGVFWFTRPQPAPAPPEPGPKPPVAAEPAWPDDYPEALRSRNWGRRIDLLRPVERPAKNGLGAELVFRPLWSRALAGASKYPESPGQFALSGRPRSPNPGCTALALDDDLARRWFEFEAEVGTQRGISPVPRSGVFFGWSVDGPGRVGAYFVQLDDAGPEPGQLRVGRLSLPAPTPGARDWAVPLDSLRDRALAQTPLRKRRTDFYRLRVRAFPDKVTVAVEGEAPMTFVPPVDPRGALGIWVQDGSAIFGRASVTALQTGGGEHPSPR